MFALALAASAAFALTRPPMYRVSQVIEVGQVETGDIPDQSRPTTYFDPPATVATVLENIHIPAARSAAESDQTNRSPLSATVSASAVADSRLVRMMAEVPPERVDAYKKFMSRAADRLIDAHGEAAESVRQRFEDALTAVQNEAATIRDTPAARKAELDRLATRERLIARQIEDLEKLIDRTQQVRVDAVSGQPSGPLAMTVIWCRTNCGRPVRT